MSLISCYISQQGLNVSSVCYTEIEHNNISQKNRPMAGVYGVRMNTAFSKLAKCAATALALAAVAGCAMLSAKNSAPHPVKLSADAKVLDVPIEKQDAASLCGLVVVDMLTKYYRQELSSEQHDSLKSIAIANNGIDGDQLVASLTKAGYYAVVYPGALDHTPTGVYSQIDNGRPVIVMLK